MSKLSRILTDRFPYPPTRGQQALFALFDELIESGPGRPVLLIKGYAGTGKTVSIASLVKILYPFNFKSVLLAPTGRAAKIMSGYSGKNAFTIHKIIYRKHIDRDTGELRFSRQKNSYRHTIFIVDEASMIQEDPAAQGEVNVLHDLIEFVFQHDSNKLILIGDDAQLPPVGRTYPGALDAGNLAGRYGLDIIESSLTEVVRQESDSGILFNATLIREKVFNENGEITLRTGGFSDVQMIGSSDLDEALQEAWSEYGISNSVIICRSNRETVSFNRFIRNHLLYRTDDLETGDSLMIVRNNYFWLPDNSPVGFLANGDFVEVLKISNREEKSGFVFADLLLKLVDYPDFEAFEAKAILHTLYTDTPSMDAAASAELFNSIMRGHRDSPRAGSKKIIRTDPYLNALQVKFTYAITCHKSQGGQWPVVFIKQPFMGKGLPDKDYYRWLYTAVSRATDLCYFVDFYK